MVFQVFIALVFLFAGAGMYLAPRNAHVGFRTSRALSCDKVWGIVNRLCGGLFFGGALMLLVVAFYGISFKDFLLVLLVICVVVTFAASRICQIEFERAKKNGEVDYGEGSNLDSTGVGKNPKKVSQKKSSKPKSELKLNFGNTSRISVFFCAFCAFIIVLCYAWIYKSADFFPQTISIKYDINDNPIAFVSNAKYFEYTLTVFWVVMLICAASLVVVSAFFANAKIFKRSFSLRVSFSEIAFSYAATFALLFAVLNYVILLRNQTNTVGFDAIISMSIPMLAIFTIWFFLFIRSKKLQAAAKKSCS